MATLLIETKVVKALQIQVDDLHRLVKAVYKTDGFIVRRTMRGEVLLDLGPIEKKAMPPAWQAQFDLEVGEITPLLPPEMWVQDLVNKGELPEGHYLVNLGKKEEHDGGQVKDYVLKLQAEIAAANAVAV
jgi:hypothetical protein